MKNENCLVITLEWLRASGCIKEDSSIDYEKFKKIIGGRRYIFDEVSSLYQNEKFVAFDEAHVLAPFPFKLK